MGRPSLFVPMSSVSCAGIEISKTSPTSPSIASVVTKVQPSSVSNAKNFAISFALSTILVLIFCGLMGERACTLSAGVDVELSGVCLAWVGWMWLGLGGLGWHALGGWAGVGCGGVVAIWQASWWDGIGWGVYRRYFSIRPLTPSVGVAAVPDLHVHSRPPSQNCEASAFYFYSASDYCPSSCASALLSPSGLLCIFLVCGVPVSCTLVLVVL